MGEFLWDARVWLQYGVCAALLLLSLWRGGGPERILSGVFVAMPVTDTLYHLLTGKGVYVASFNIGHFVIDAVAFAILYGVALRANRLYPLCIASVQLIALVSHLYKLVILDFDMLAYQIMQTMPSYVQIVALTIGLRAHIARQRELGSYPSWRTSLPPTPARAPSPLQGA